MSVSVKRIRAVIIARNREFYRDKAGLGWNLFMPLMMILGFAFLFSGDANSQFTVGIIGDQLPAAESSPFLGYRHIRFTAVKNAEAGIDKVRYHRLDLLLDPRGTPRYWINQQSPKGYLAERLLRSAYAEAPALQREIVSGRQIRYVDWVLPGILSLNMTFSSLWGVGWVIVRYRKNGVLRRLRATPLTAFEFLTAQVVSRLLVVSVTSTLVFIAALSMLDIPMRGSYPALALLFLAGSLCMISLGLLVAARLRNEEMADGLLNLISWPMMIASGVWFSMEGTHPIAQAVSNLFPLTHLVNGARAIMLDGAGFADTLAPMALLLGTGALLLIGASRIFRWQ